MFFPSCRVSRGRTTPAEEKAKRGKREAREKIKPDIIADKTANAEVEITRNKRTRGSWLLSIVFEYASEPERVQRSTANTFKMTPLA